MRASGGPPGLRPWQEAALSQFEASDQPNFLAVATPGAGKTTFALTAARRALVARRIRRVVIVVPTQHLKHQWARAAEALDIHLDPDWSVGYGGLPSDVHGVVATYQQIAVSAAAFRGMVPGAFVILDEVHHAGDSRSWGDGVRQAFEPAWRRLCLSGTPFRSDQITIPFVRYDGDLAHADYEYGYGEALADGRVVRPVYFPRINGRMEWTAPDGATYEATFDDRLARDLASQRLRTALDVEGDWLPTVLANAHAQLLHLRAVDPSAGALAIAIDQEHAKGIAAILYDKLGVLPVVATSDDPDASEKIARFSESGAPWIVAVRMVSEGVDIPRLRVGVYATNTITELFFRQAVGRLVRWSARLRKQAAYMFIPDDIRLRKFATAIAEQRRHTLRKESDGDDGPGERPPAPPRPEEAEDPFTQLNLFAAISSTPLDEHGRELDEVRVYASEEAAADGHPEPEIPDMVDPSRVDALTGPAGRTAGLGEGRSGLRWEQAPVPAPEADPNLAARARSAGLPGSPGAPALTPLARRRFLREENSEIVRDLVHRTGRSHAEINIELNKKVGIRRISEATIKQLEQRLVAARSITRKK
ncbi:MAG TPA: DEAD/DEAH box helicase family protein [Polyangia bacterium]